MEKTISFLAGMLFMVTFGIMDNLFLFVGMDWLNPVVDMFKDPQLSGMLGNTFSDIVGAIAGAGVSYIVLKIFKIKPSEHILVEIAGVTIGCLMPIGIYLILI